MTNVMTKVDRNILDYVFYGVWCNHCKTQLAFLLGDILSKAPIVCSQCNKAIQLQIDHHLLQSLYTNIGSYCKQLRNAGIDLYFVHKTESTSEIPHPKPSTDT